jgi:serine/threonine protein kinase
VVSIFQVGEDDGTPFIVMELLEGMDLESRIRKKGRLPILEAVGYIRDAVFGLKAAEEAGVIHRDIKPANLFVVEGRVKVTDFGLARPLDGSENVTKTGLLTGSPHFMPPERVKGEPEDFRSDIYALGVTFFTILAGRPPFARESPIDTISAHVTEEPPSIRKYCKDATVRVEQLLKRMMAKAPEKRFNRYDSLLYALDTATRDMMGFDLPSRMADASAESEPVKETSSPAPAQKAESPPAKEEAKAAPVNEVPEAAPVPKEPTPPPARQEAQPAPVPKEPTPPPARQEAQAAPAPKAPQSPPAREEAQAAPAPKAPKPPPARKEAQAAPAPKAPQSPPAREEAQAAPVQEKSEVASVKEAVEAKGAPEPQPEPPGEKIESLPELHKVQDHTTSTQLQVPEDVDKLGPVPTSAPFEYEAPPPPAAKGPGLMARWGKSIGGLAGQSRKNLGATAFGLLQNRMPAWQNLDDEGRQKVQLRLGLLVPLGLLGFVLVFGLALTLILGGGGVLDRIDGGEAAAVLAEMDSIDDADLKATDLLVRGHALYALKRHDEALVTLQKALEAGAHDQRAMDTALGELWRQSPKAAITLLGSMHGSCPCCKPRPAGRAFTRLPFSKSDSWIRMSIVRPWAFGSSTTEIPAPSGQRGFV